MMELAILEEDEKLLETNKKVETHLHQLLQRVQWVPRPSEKRATYDNLRKVSQFMAHAVKLRKLPYRIRLVQLTNRLLHVCVCPINIIHHARAHVLLESICVCSSYTDDVHNTTARLNGDPGMEYKDDFKDANILAEDIKMDVSSIEAAIQEQGGAEASKRFKMFFDCCCSNLSLHISKVTADNDAKIAEITQKINFRLENFTPTSDEVDAKEVQLEAKENDKVFQKAKKALDIFVASNSLANVKQCTEKINELDALVVAWGVTTIVSSSAILVDSDQGKKLRDKLKVLYEAYVKGKELSFVSKDILEKITSVLAAKQKDLSQPAPDVAEKKGKAATATPAESGTEAPAKAKKPAKAKQAKAKATASD